MTPNQFPAYLAEKYDLTEEAAQAIFDEAWPFILTYAGRAFPVMSRDMVSRGQVQSWLFRLADDDGGDEL